MSYNEGGIVYGERMGKKFVKSGPLSIENDLYQAHLSIETNPDPISRMLIKRDINVGFKAEIASRGQHTKRNIIN